MVTGKPDNSADSTKELEKYLKRKGKVNTELWNTISLKANGTVTEKSEAVSMIFKSYPQLPREADDVLKTLVEAEAENKVVRKAIAIEMAQENVSISGGLYFHLIGSLINDPDDEIRRIVGPNFDKYVKEPMECMLKAKKAIQDHITEAMLRFAKLAEEYQQAMAKSMGPLLETLFRISQIFNEPEYQTFQYNWLAFLSIDQVISLYKMHKQGKDAEIQQILIDVSNNQQYLEDFLKEMERSSIFQPRIRIIKDAMEAHLDCKYSLSVPVLLAQVEGIIWEIAMKNGVKFKDEIMTKKGKKSLLISAKDLLTITKVKDEIFEYAVKEYLKNINVEDFRHGILHGRIIDYDTAENSTKLLLFLRALLEDCR
jgi:hypothetical protein